jgi:hypothetical protein
VFVLAFGKNNGYTFDTDAFTSFVTNIVALYGVLVPSKQNVITEID